MGSATGEAALSRLREEVVRLGPWLIDVEVEPGLTTQDAQGAAAYPDSYGRVGFYSPREHFVDLLRRLYPDGLEGRSVLDCACNCAAFSFWAKEEGAGECLSFDVREHWIEQARFLARHRAAPSDGMRFEVLDLYDLPELGDERFDVTIFNGILYHLPDPVTGLKVAADLTNELMIVNTATKVGYPDGVLVAGRESSSKVASGVYGLNWFPSGPRVLGRIFEWLGFPAWRCSRWRATEDQGPGLGRMEVIAARDPALLERYDAGVSGADAVLEQGRTAIPPLSAVLVLSGGDERLLEIRGREGRHFPARSADEGHAPDWPRDGAEAVAHLEALRAAGGAYLLVPESERSWLDGRPLLARHIEEAFSLYAQADGVCRVYALKEAIHG
jgi:hypothetical protein